MKIKYILIYLILFFSLPVLSQTAISLPYFCGFEDTSENANWILNPGPNGNSVNRWFIGTATSDMGRRSLYISIDGGTTALYSGTQGRCIVAYREMQMGAGNYEISFTWKAGGDADARLYALWMPANVQTQTLNTNTLGTTWVPYKCSFGGSDYLSGSTGWQNAVTTVNVPSPPQNGGLYKLVFVWTNADGRNQQFLGGCIDNVQISSVSSICPPPYNLNYLRQGTSDLLSGNSITITWQGTASSYDIQYRIYGESAIYSATGVAGNTFTLNNLSEGLYDFWIRANCNSSESSRWVSLKNVPLYNPDAHCLDFINFTGSGVIASYGKGSSSQPYGNPNASVGAIDFGYASSSSRHTIHYMPEEYDAETGYGLKTVPEEEVVSVRLGNSGVSYECERLTYSYTVGQDVGILLFQYAIVFEEPGHANPPRFTLEILDTKDQLLDQICGSADFTTEDAHGVWNQAGNIWWKDWTQVGLNMQQYQGQTIKIRVTTYDCGQGGHFGYAYFTLSCASATIESNSCGGSSTLSVTAPEGFDYEWRKAGNSTVLGTDREFNVNTTDSGTYVVDVIYKEERACRFQLTALIYPRVPVARATYLYAPELCRNIVRTINTSGIIKSDKDTTMLTGEKVDRFYWDFGDGRTSNEEAPLIEYPQSGGTYTVKLKVGIAEDVCMDSTEFTVIIPEIGASTDTIKREICQAGSIWFDGKRYTAANEGDNPIVKSSKAGCDSTIILHLTVVPNISVELYDTACYNETYIFNGQPYKNYNRPNTPLIATVKSTGGCDSTTTLWLHVRDQIHFSATVTDAMTGANSGAIAFDPPLPAGYNYEINGEFNGSLTGLSAGNYAVVVYDEEACPSDTIEYVIQTSCLDLTLLPVDQICADDGYFQVEYELNSGYLSTYSIEFDSTAIEAGFEDMILAPISNNDPDKYITIPLSDGIRPDYYSAKVIFHDVNCAGNDNEFDIEFLVKYSPEIVEQKWNDVLAILNEKYNGNYFFSSYQWYRNGEKLEGQNGSYLYLGEGNRFNLSDTYHVSLQRGGDTYFIETCPIPVTLRTELSVSPTLVGGGQLVYIKSKMSKINVRVWDSMGQLRTTKNINGGEGELTMPFQPGIYLLELLLEDTGERKTEYVIVH